MRFIFSIQYQVGYTEAAFVYGDAKTQPIRWRDTASASAWRIRCKARADIARQIAHVQNAGGPGRRAEMQRGGCHDIAAPGAFDAHLRPKVQAQVARPGAWPKARQTSTA